MHRGTGPDQGLRQKHVAVKGIDLTRRTRAHWADRPQWRRQDDGAEGHAGPDAVPGQLKVLGRDPWSERDLLMQDVCFIADVAVLPRWLKVSQALDFVAGVHPNLIAPKPSAFARTVIKRGSKVGALSKGMVAQLHLALVMAIEAKLLVLDEPTLGLDILFRKQFYDSLINDYYDGDRTIVITTITPRRLSTSSLTWCSSTMVASRSTATMDALQARYTEVRVDPAHVVARGRSAVARAAGVWAAAPAV